MAEAKFGGNFGERYTSFYTVEAYMDRAMGFPLGPGPFGATHFSKGGSPYRGFIGVLERERWRAFP